MRIGPTSSSIVGEDNIPPGNITKRGWKDDWCQQQRWDLSQIGMGGSGDRRSCAHGQGFPFSWQCHEPCSRDIAPAQQQGILETSTNTRILESLVPLQAQRSRCRTKAGMLHIGSFLWHFCTNKVSSGGRKHGYTMSPPHI